MRYSAHTKSETEEAIKQLALLVATYSDAATELHNFLNQLSYLDGIQGAVQMASITLTERLNWHQSQLIKQLGMFLKESEK